MYKVSNSVKIYSSSGRLAVKRALPLFAILYFSLILIPFTFSSCATRRDTLTHSVVTDTTHVIVTDTTHIVSVRDSTVLTEREVIHEHIVTLYDPDTGHPIEQTTDRDITRQRDSLVTHLRDSIYRALQLEAIASRTDSTRHEEHHATGSAAQPPFLYAIKWIVLYAIIIGFICSILYIIIKIFHS